MDDDWGDFSSATPAAPAKPTVPSATPSSPPPTSAVPVSTAPPAATPQSQISASPLPPKANLSAAQLMGDADEFDDFSKPQSLDSIAAFLAGASSPAPKGASPAVSKDAEVPKSSSEGTASLTSPAVAAAGGDAFSTFQPHINSHFPARTAPQQPAPPVAAVADDDLFGDFSSPVFSSSPVPARAQPQPLALPITSFAVPISVSPSGTSSTPALQASASKGNDADDDLSGFNAAPVDSPPKGTQEPRFGSFAQLAPLSSPVASVLPPTTVNPSTQLNSPVVVEDKEEVSAFAAPMPSASPAVSVSVAVSTTTLPSTPPSTSPLPSSAPVPAPVFASSTTSPAAPHQATTDNDFGNFSAAPPSPVSQPASPALLKIASGIPASASDGRALDISASTVAQTKQHSPLVHDDEIGLVMADDFKPSHTQAPTKFRPTPTATTTAPASTPVVKQSLIIARSHDDDFGDFATPSSMLSSLQHVTADPLVSPVTVSDDFGSIASATPSPVHVASPVPTPAPVSTTTTALSSPTPTPASIPTPALVVTPTTPAVADDGNDFGDFAASALPQPAKQPPLSPPPAPVAKPPVDDGDDFSDFAAPSVSAGGVPPAVSQITPLASGQIAAPASATARDPATVDDGDDFGDFAAPSVPAVTAPTPTISQPTPSPIQPSAQTPAAMNGEDDFSDFAAPSAPAAKAPPVAPQKSPAVSEDADDEFGDFAAPAPVPKQTPAKLATATDDDFGDFATEKAAPVLVKVSTTTTTAAATPPLTAVDRSMKKDDFSAFASTAKSAPISADTPIWRLPPSDLGAAARRAFGLATLPEPKTHSTAMRLRDLLLRREGREQFWSTNRCAKCDGYLQQSAQVCFFCGQGVAGASRREAKFAGSVVQKRFIDALRIPEPPPPKPSPTDIPKIPEVAQHTKATTAPAPAAARVAAGERERRDSQPLPRAARADSGSNPAPRPVRADSGSNPTAPRALSPQPKPKGATSVIDQLTSMGWNKEQAPAALAAADGNVNGAIDILTSQAAVKSATSKPSAPAKGLSDSGKKASAGPVATPAKVSDDPFDGFFAAPAAAKSAAKSVAPSTTPSSSSPFDLDFLMGTAPAAKSSRPTTVAAPGASTFDDFLQFDMNTVATPATSAKNTQNIVDELLTHMPDFSYMLARPI